MKLIASDLDGTLLLKGEKKLNSRILKSLEMLKASEIDFSVASGRTYGELLRIFDGLCQNTYFIALDGALVVKDGKSLYGSPFSKEDLKIINDFPEFVLHGKYMTYVKSDYPYFIRKIKGQYNGHAVRISDVSEIKDCTFKLVLYKNFRTLKKLPFDMVYKDNTLCEFVKEGINKGIALKKLMNGIGAEPDDCAAFGDSENDVEFLKSCTNSYAVKNSKHEIRKICKYYTDDIAQAIESIIKEAAK
ncbi:MAG: HAD family phosphatase [Clostridia bacterium]|nr:HAD family phosphatase [Clostridia bacterium]